MSENMMKVFEHSEFGRVRVIDQDGEPWFVAKEVAEILGYVVPAKMYARLDDDEKLTFQDGSSGQLREMVLINESGLYNAILGSQKSEAKRFKKWVTSEVLPDIRKYGFHGTQSFVERALSDPDGMITLLLSYKQEKERRALAERQRDEAVATKAWISDKKTATAMNTASQLSKEKERLCIAIGDATNWKKVKAIKWLREEFVLSPGMYQAVGKRLSALSKRMGYEKKFIEDTEHGTIGAYNIDVIEAFRLDLKKDLNMMPKYRRRK